MLYRKIMQKKWTHHIFPQEQRDIYNVHIKENKIDIDRKEHDALHILFDDDLPREQLLKILQLNKEVISPEILGVLKEILEVSEEEFYIKEIFGRKYQKTQ